MENKNNEQGKENEVKEPALKFNYISPDEFLEMERTSPPRYEYLDGRVVKKRRASQNNIEINSVLLGEIFQYLKDKPSRAYPPGMKVMSIDRKSFSYPDMIIFGGDPMMVDFERDTMVNPGVLVDIFSNETELNDLEEKFKYYQRIPTLREYIMIDSWRWHARFKRQQPNREWRSYDISGSKGELTIQEIGFTLSFEKLYSNTTIWHFNK